MHLDYPRGAGVFACSLFAFCKVRSPYHAVLFNINNNDAAVNGVAALQNGNDNQQPQAIYPSKKQGGFR